MATFNPNYSPKVLVPGYLFPKITEEVNEFLATTEDKTLFRMGIGDAKYMSKTCLKIGAEALMDETKDGGFKGYPDDHGVEDLRRAIAEKHYGALKVAVDWKDVFIGCGAKEDCANFPDILGPDNVMAMQDPVYPVYKDTNVMAGRKIITLPCVPENDFLPELPKEKVDVLYLCYPNNPTGATPKKEQLQKYVDWANENNVLILFDAAYEAFIRTPGIPHSIYELDGAKNCAVEFCSFSKTAGFTDKRCSWVVVPKDIKVMKAMDEITLHGAWGRRQSTKFNGVSYHIQVMAKSCFTNEDVKRENIEIREIYHNNANIIRTNLTEAGWKVWGGIDSPYVWAKLPGGMTSWNGFRKILREARVVTTPGEGFGPAGEGFIRFSAFNLKGVPEIAMKRVRELQLSA